MADINVILKQTDRLVIVPEIVTPIPPVNIPPLVNIGIDRQIKLPLSEVDLTAVVSDPENDALTYQWTKVSGGNANILTATAKNTKITGLVLGDYMFRLTVTDAKGGKTADDLNIKVLPPDVVIPPSGTVKYLELPLLSDGTAANDAVISNKRITNSNTIVMNLVGKRNIRFVDCFFDYAKEEAISFENSNGLLVERCLFNNVACGVYGLGSSNVRVIKSQFVNVRQRPQGGRGQFVQLNGCSSGAGSEVSDCKGENFAGESDPEDLISLFRSYGTSAVPFYVRRNMFRGGGPSASGGGIMTGDYGGSWQVVDGNILLDPGQYGIAAAGGYDIQLINNKIYARQQPFTNNPLYVWGQQGASGGNITVKGNRVNWTDKTGNKNNGWNAGNIPNVSFESPTTITLAEMNVPTHLIDFITPADLLKIRGK